MLNRIALATLGYVAYYYVRRGSELTPTDAMPRVAGGPLRSNASLQNSLDLPPFDPV